MFWRRSQSDDVVHARPYVLGSSCEEVSSPTEGMMMCRETSRFGPASTACELMTMIAPRWLVWSPIKRRGSYSSSVSFCPELPPYNDCMLVLPLLVVQQCYPEGFGTICFAFSTWHISADHQNCSTHISQSGERSYHPSQSSA